MNYQVQKLFIGLVVTLITFCNAREFLYPVDTLLREEEEFCVLYQKNSHLELWFWNPLTKLATKGLLSSFTPAGLSILPHKQGFSFIDSDRIRVKLLTKRSPKTLDFYGPYNLSVVTWITNNDLYFSAQERQHFNLFHGTIEGDLFRLTASVDYHYLYPQKVGDFLFFIQKKEGESCVIIRSLYPVTVFDGEHREHSIELKDREEILTFKKTSTIVFLKMIDESHGFFIEHPAYVNRSDQTVVFSYHTFFTIDNKTWDMKKLFSFELPLELLIQGRSIQSDDRLYESILPLLPFHDAGFIYFSDLMSKNGAINVFSYNLDSEQITQKTCGITPEDIYFPPRRYRQQLLCGGCLQKTASQKYPQMYIDVDEELHFVFLSI